MDPHEEDSNVTIADNFGIYATQGVARASGTVTIKNSILWNNGMDATGTMALAYCDIGTPDVTVTTNDCIGVDPLFADAVGDYRLKSSSGRWDPSLGGGVGGWVTDGVSSPCIDAGDPNDPLPANLLEPQPNGGRVNMGAYGNSAYASKSPSAAGILLMIQ